MQIKLLKAGSSATSSKCLAEAAASSVDRVSFSVPGLTGVRALAAFWVLAFHYFGLLGSRALPLSLAGHSFHMQYLLTIGWIGVHVFFVLSGFLLALPFLRYHFGMGPKPSLPDYLKRRVLRVIPAYWVILVVLIAGAGVIGSAAPAAGDLAGFFFMLQASGATWQAAGAFWTLPIEFEFYLLLPILIWLFLGRAPCSPTRALGRCGLLLATALVISASYRALVFAWVKTQAVHPEVWFLMNQLPPLLHEFALGICASALFLRFQNTAWRQRAWFWDLWMCVGLLGTLAMMIQMDIRFRDYWDNQPISYYWPVVSSLFIACLIFGVAGRGSLSRLFFENRVVFAIGTISYSVYLWHYPVGLFFSRVLLSKRIDSAHEAAFVAAATGTTLAISTISYLLIERPFVRFSQRAAITPSKAVTPVGTA